MSGAHSVASSSVLPSQSNRTQLYQIDFAAVAAGKRIASTKRRIRWRFGFANPEALTNGLTGTACRGEEHDITVVWSVASGKRLILADGHEVHYSNSRSGILDVSWTMRGNHVLKVVAHSSPPLSATPGFRQYDFFVDGQSFFTFPKVFRLGLTANDPRGFANPRAMVGTGRNYTNNLDVPTSTLKRRNSNTIVTIEAPHNHDEEEAYLREAIKNSLEETRKPISSGASVASAPPSFRQSTDLLLDFSDPSPALPASAPFESIAFGSNSSLPPVQSNALVPISGQSVGSNYGFNAAAYSSQSNASPYPFNSAPTPTTANGYIGQYTEGGFPSYGAPALGPSFGAISQASSYGPPELSSFYGGPVPAASPPYGAPAPSSSVPYGVQAHAASAPYSAPAPANSAPHGAPVQANSAPHGAPAPANSAPYGAPALGTSVPYGASPAAFYPSAASLDPFAPQPSGAPTVGSPAPQAPVSNFSSPSAQQTPSTLGFASPPYFASPNLQTPAVAPSASQPFGAALEPTTQQRSAFAAPAPVSENPAYSMYNYGGQGNQLQQQSEAETGNPADHMYSKFASMDTFELVSKGEPAKGNPFEVYNAIGPQPSLADMKSMSKDAPKKEIMRTPVPAPSTGELVVANSQPGSWGTLFGAAQSSNYGTAPQAAYGPGFNPEAAYGVTPAYNPPASFQSQSANQGYSQTSSYGLQPQAYGQQFYQQPQQPQQFTQQQQYGQNAYGQNTAPQGYY